MLSAKGRRLLAGASSLSGALADPRRRFLAADGLLDPHRAEAGRLLLERHLLPHLARIDHPIPPEATWEMTENYSVPTRFSSFPYLSASANSPVALAFYAGTGCRLLPDDGYCVGTQWVPGVSVVSRR
jgi:hypothetical protein